MSRTSPKHVRLTRADILARLAYDPETGLFTHVVGAGGHVAGTVAGCLTLKGYVQLDVHGEKLLAHRVAWFLMHGAWPEADVDHRDTIRHHNWIENLRPCTRKQNMENIRRPMLGNRTGLLGVMPSANGKRFIAQIRRSLNDTSHYIGTFDTAEEAHAAYLAAKVIHHPFQTLVLTDGC